MRRALSLSLFCISASIIVVALRRKRLRRRPERQHEPAAAAVTREAAAPPPVTELSLAPVTVGARRLELLVHNVSHGDMVLALGLSPDAALRECSGTGSDSRESRKPGTASDAAGDSAALVRPKFSLFHPVSRTILARIGELREAGLGPPAAEFSAYVRQTEVPGGYYPINSHSGRLGHTLPVGFDLSGRGAIPVADLSGFKVRSRDAHKLGLNFTSFNLGAGAAAAAGAAGYPLTLPSPSALTRPSSGQDMDSSSSKDKGGGGEGACSSCTPKNNGRGFWPSPPLPLVPLAPSGGSINSRGDSGCNGSYDLRPNGWQADEASAAAIPASASAGEAAVSPVGAVGNEALFSSSRDQQQQQQQQQWRRRQREKGQAGNGTGGSSSPPPAAYITGVFFPLLAVLLPKWKASLQEDGDGDCDKVIYLVSGVGVPRNRSHRLDDNSTEATAQLMKKFLAIHYPDVRVKLLHSKTNLFRYDDNIRFVQRELLPAVNAERQRAVEGYGDRWSDMLHVTVSFADGSPARISSINAALRHYRPSFMHHWELKTFWHEAKVCEDDIEMHTFEDIGTIPPVPAAEVDPLAALAVAEMLRLRDDFEAILRDRAVAAAAALAAPGGAPAATVAGDDLSQFWLRKTKKPVLAVLVVQRGSCPPRVYRGTNMEVSMPTGSLCAERNVIGSALADDLRLRRQDLRIVAVMGMTLPREEDAAAAAGGRSSGAGAAAAAAAAWPAPAATPVKARPTPLSQQPTVPQLAGGGSGSAYGYGSSPADHAAAAAAAREAHIRGGGALRAAAAGDGDGAMNARVPPPLDLARLTAAGGSTAAAAAAAAAAMPAPLVPLPAARGTSRETLHGHESPRPPRQRERANSCLDDVSAGSRDSPSIPCGHQHQQHHHGGGSSSGNSAAAAGSGSGSGALGGGAGIATASSGQQQQQPRSRASSIGASPGGGGRRAKMVRSLSGRFGNARVVSRVRTDAARDPNPLRPCGACMEWLKKIDEVNPDFRVLTFTNSGADGVFLESVAQIG